jgi:hypothetical protein
MFENRVQRGIFGQKKDEVTAVHEKKLHNKKHHNMHPTLNIIRMTSTGK